jgi:outer membrane murein-binding lipoprotein Lpp
MTQEMTSFVLRFVREMSEEQGARWRGLVQHVQSGAEDNFATFAQAVRFMQGHVVDSTVRTMETGEEQMDANPFVCLAGEMTKLWGDWGPQMTEMWAQTVEQMMDQSAVFRSQVDQAVATTLKAWGLPSGADQDVILSSLARLGGQIDQLAARVEALEAQVTAGQTLPKRGRAGKRTTQESAE